MRGGKKKRRKERSREENEMEVQGKKHKQKKKIKVKEVIIFHIKLCVINRKKEPDNNQIQSSV